MNDDLTCQQVVQLVTDYLEGALPPADHERFERHLADCPDCDANLEQMRQTIALTRTLCVEDVPPRTMEVLIRAYRTR